MKKMVLMASLLASAASTSLARAEDDVLTLCSGAEGGVYEAAGEAIAKMTGKATKIRVIRTEGTVDNLRRLIETPAGDPEGCDAALAQPDGPVWYARKSPAAAKKIRQAGPPLHREYLHVLCSKASGVDDLGDIVSSGGSVAVGKEGSGAWLIWQNILSEDDSYSAVPVTSEGGKLALSAVSSDQTTCMLQPAGLRNGLVSEADQLYGESVVLVSANDKDFNDATNIAGKPLYSYEYEIPGDAYPNSFDYWSDVETISWSAAVYFNPDKIADERVVSALIDAVARAAPGIRAEYGE